jgi:methionine synthase I (cobalamin-dependent)
MIEAWLADGVVVVTDGAWGTQLQARGLSPGEASDPWNLSHPEAVEAVARSYVEAGSRWILTNTFRANAVAFHGRATGAELEAMNRAGVVLSRRAAGGTVAVCASMGPTGKLLGAGEIEAEVVSAALAAQAAALASAGADALLFETFSDLEEAKRAVDAALPTGLPVLVSFAFDHGRSRDRTMTGATPEAVGAAMRDAGASVVGANCGSGPEAFPEVARRLAAASGLPVWVKPNAGLPVMEGGVARYTMGAEAFAEHVPALVAAGARFVGGCCGTDPEFIRAVVGRLASCGSR